MRNIFDQYTSPENRLTHALGCALLRDRNLLRGFVRWATGRTNLDWRKLQIVEQQVPGTHAPDAWAEEESGDGLPDLWIHGDGNWSLVIESKVMAPISADQLHRHRRMARRNGFTDVDLLVLAPQSPAVPIDGVNYRTWRELYCWLRRQQHHQPKSTWAQCMSQYMEIAEARMTADKYLDARALTEFDGIPFGPEHPYSYREGKRVLQLALEKLRARRDLRRLGIDPQAQGRPAITGKDGTSVWDFLSLRAASGKGSFTACPHLTLGIQEKRAIVIVTLPNAVAAPMRRNLVGLEAEGFAKLAGDVARKIERAIRPVKKPRAYPFMEVVQQHFPSQKARSIQDARLEFDLRTATGSPMAGVRRQPQWLAAAYQALAQKRSNLQIGIGAVLPYGDPMLHTPRVLEVIASVWVGCEPWIKTILEQ